MLLGDAHIEIPFGKTLGELLHSGAFAHGGRDRDHSGVTLGHIAQPAAKHLRVRRLRGCLGGNAHLGIELSWAVVENRVRLGLPIPLAFARDHVQKMRTF